jgi:hypothetical protein
MLLLGRPYCYKFLFKDAVSIKEDDGYLWWIGKDRKESSYDLFGGFIAALSKKYKMACIRIEIWT